MTVSGTVPSYLNGTYYKAVMFNAIEKNGKVHTSGGLGSVLSVSFTSGQPPTASFGFVRGNDYKALCYPPPSGPPTGLYASSGAVTVNSACGHGRVCAVTAMPECPALQGGSLDTVEAPEVYAGDSMGKRQLPFPSFAAPGFFMGAHMPADANGDNYGAAYIHDPAPAFRVFRIKYGTPNRTVFPDIPASPQPGDNGTASAPSYNHMALAFTPSFLLLPEMPTRMPKMFDWAAIQKSWIEDGTFYWRILDKATGKPLARYALPAMWSWHNINAWENKTHITVDITWAKNASALNGFVQGKFSSYPGKLARIIMPNPTAPGAPTDGAAAIEDLTSMTDARVPTPEFGVVNPAHMWKRPTRYIWASAAVHKATPAVFYNTVFRLDTSDGSIATWSPDGLIPGAPEFVPAASDQDPDSAAGAVLVLAIGSTSVAQKPSLVILDGETHNVVATLTLPILPLASPGLHNHWSAFPTST